jgi:acetyl esterase/lipase
VPVVVFLHGGAYVRGDRGVNAEVYGNVATYFARQGMLGVNGTYRLAPAAQWPAAAQDVGLLVQWLKANAAAHGGDPSRIYLVGHSAGATHVATYVYQKDLHPADGPGVSGIVLMSGRYHFDPKADDPNLRNFQAYFGTDAGRYPAQSPINHVKTAKPFPTFVVISEYDNPDLDTQGALLLAALCERDRVCPRFTRMGLHNHLSMVYQFNTADDALGREIQEFIRRGR